MHQIRKKLFYLLEGWGQASSLGRFTDAFLVCLIVINIVAVTVSSIPEYHDRYFGLWMTIEVVSLIIFTVEYFARIWVCIEAPDLAEINSFKARLKFILRPIMIIDLLAILPMYLFAFGAVGVVDIRYLRVFRMLRILKLVRYSPAMQIVTDVIKAEKRAILSALLLGLVVLLLASSMIHMVEHKVQPDKFGSIPQSMWWAMATLTTVGYGDVIPVTTVGKLLGSVVMLMGIGVFGLWAGIMASGFSEELRRRGFRVKWQMLAHCKVFESLDTRALIDLSKKMRPMTLPARMLISRKGVRADTIYIVVSGQVEAELPNGLRLLGAGDMFGELGLLHGGTTATTFIAVEDVRLIAMNIKQFEELMDTHAEVADKIRLLAESRMSWFDPDIREKWLNDLKPKKQ
ncbi:MAG: cyclic nucleotide-gated ion channel [Alphaproteobacteria bacterium]|nr:cyclic nucleotide-gated ion channel [Alphaproteobacteria bacterium]